VAASVSGGRSLNASRTIQRRGARVRAALTVDAGASARIWPAAPLLAVSARWAGGARATTTSPPAAVPRTRSSLGRRGVSRACRCCARPADPRGRAHGAAPLPLSAARRVPTERALTADRGAPGRGRRLVDCASRPATAAGCGGLRGVVLAWAPSRDASSPAEHAPAGWSGGAEHVLCDSFLCEPGIPDALHRSVAMNAATSISASRLGLRRSRGREFGRWISWVVAAIYRPQPPRSTDPDDDRAAAAGSLLAFEGGEGSGKTTQVRMLADVTGRAGCAGRGA
jgi:hypothetical protein